MIFNNPYWFLLLAVMAPLAAWAIVAGRKLRAARLRLIVAERLQPAVVSAGDPTAERYRLACFLLGCVMLVTALARPMLTKREESVKRKGADFLVAIDMSRSMLARDALPDQSRFHAARRAVKDLLSRLSGDRVGLIAVSGEARLLTPMTFNYQSLELILDGMEPGRGAIRPGSNLAQAIRVAAAKLAREEMEARVLVIISDGEDLEGDALLAAREAKLNQRLTIFTVGVGSHEGASIITETRDAGGNVVSTEKLKDVDGNEVVSKLDETMLRAIAQSAGGAYIYLRGRPLDSVKPSVLHELYEQKIRPLAASLRVAKVVAYEEIYQIPLGLAAALFLAEIVLRHRRRARV